jgi:voltage-gated potassium channel Kch
MMISRSRQVNAKIILESINGYLLMGVMFALLVALVMYDNPAAFRFPEMLPQSTNPSNGFSDNIYFTLVSMTTLGYGDIVPLSPGAKSLASFISVSGQLYIAIIIALLVGKFASKSNQTES